ncbi:MAG TPA: thioredoxin domain-containing protein [Anaerolineales bacterium]|nr:thioredoxin domain-containing protein [Anaerolineales bacterium]
MRRQKTDQTSRLLVIGITTFVAIAVVAVLVISNRPSQTDPDLLDLIETLPKGIDVTTGLPYIGEEDAPVTMLIYEDLGCPNCRTYNLNVEPLVLRDYVATGDVRIMIYTLAFVNQQSLPAAEGTLCALDQELFWEYRDVVFNNQGVRTYNRESLIAFAGEVGMDIDAFTRCYDFGAHTETILERSNRALDFGITGTPTTEINGARHVGVLPYEQEGEQVGVKELIEAALAVNR